MASGVSQAASYIFFFKNRGSIVIIIIIDHQYQPRNKVTVHVMVIKVTNNCFTTHVILLRWTFSVSCVSKLHLKPSALRRTFWDMQIFWLSWLSLSGTEWAHVMFSALIPLFVQWCCWQTGAHSTLIAFAKKHSMFYSEGGSLETFSRTQQNTLRILLKKTTKQNRNKKTQKGNSWWQTSQIWLLTKCESSDLCTENCVHHITAKSVSNWRYCANKHTDKTDKQTGGQTQPPSNFSGGLNKIIQ